MSGEKSFVSIFDSFEDHISSIKSAPSTSNHRGRQTALLRNPRYSEEARQEQAYEAFKQDLSDSFQLDARMENDFFGRRHLSMSDLVETGYLGEPITPHIRADCLPNDNHTLTARVPASPATTSHVIYLANKEASLTPTACAESAELPHTCCSCGHLKTLPSGLAEISKSPLYYVEGFVFEHPPTSAQLRQKYYEQSQLPISPTSPDWTPRTSIVGRTLFGPDQNMSKEFDDRSEFDTLLARRQSMLSMHNSELLAGLEKSIHPSGKLDNRSICDVGFVNTSVVVQEDLTERAYIPSQVAEISNVPTPELIENDENYDLDTVKTDLECDASPGTPHSCNQADVKVASGHLQDYIAVTQSGRHSGGSLDMDQAAEHEEDCNNARFNDTSDPSRNSLLEPQESPAAVGTKPTEVGSPCINHECVDLGQEHRSRRIFDNFAHSPCHPGPNLPQQDTSISTKARLDQSEDSQVVQDLGERPGLQPLALSKAPFRESALVKRRTKQNIDSASPISQQVLPAKTFNHDAKYDIVSFFKGKSTISYADEVSPPPVRISKAPDYVDTPRVKKRSARESFGLIELCDENARREHSRKKPRLVTTPTFDPAIRLPPTPPSTISSCFDDSLLTTVLKGYPGQFEVHISPKPLRPKQKPAKHVFGNHLHANGEIINLKYIADPFTVKTDLSDLPDLGPTIEEADLHHAFAEEMPRTVEEEDLRKEAHRECAAARLEGVPVGYYRYFAGHMTVEDYIEAKMCVCWQGCFCNKLCTHFGDLACPCVGNLVVGDEV